MKRLLILLFLPLILLFLPLIAFAEPPYDIRYNFQQPTTGGVVVGYHAYVDDCDIAGPVGSPSAVVAPGEWVNQLITVDGTYQFCTRAFNNTGEQPDPGVVITATVAQEPLPGPVTIFDVEVRCRLSDGTVIPCADAGVNVTVTTN